MIDEVIKTKLDKENTEAIMNTISTARGVADRLEELSFHVITLNEIANPKTKVNNGY
jgi:hypothetical protein